MINTEKDESIRLWQYMKIKHSVVECSISPMVRLVLMEPLSYKNKHVLYYTYRVFFKGVIRIHFLSLYFSTFSEWTNRYSTPIHKNHMIRAVSILPSVDQGREYVTQEQRSKTLTWHYLTALIWCIINNHFEHMKTCKQKQSIVKLENKT
jgi:hypothetical protein